MADEMTHQLSHSTELLLKHSEAAPDSPEKYLDPTETSQEHPEMILPEEIQVKFEEDFEEVAVKEEEEEYELVFESDVKKCEPSSLDQQQNNGSDNPFGLIKMVDGHIVYECEYCAKTFDKRCMIIRHRRMHTGEKPHCCPLCGKGFSDRSNFTKHVRTHKSATHEVPAATTTPTAYNKGNNQYECDRCKKSYATMFNLKRHLKIHASKGEPSTDEQNLRQSLEHGIEKAQAKCDKCGQTFINTNRLTQHQKTGCYYTALQVLKMSKQLGGKKSNIKRK